MRHLSFFSNLVVCVHAVAQLEQNLSSRQSAQIPQYVIDYAPLVYLDVNDYYLPSDIQAQVTNTYPALNFDQVDPGNSNYSLSNLSSLNEAGGCSFRRFGSCDLYLTSQNETSYPPFFNGTLPDPKTGETKDATACAVIVNDHGDGTVDAFYMYFYAFNLGYVLFGGLYGNHVGDWEHTMVRFIDGEPDSMWFSQHDGGEVYTYSAVSKQQGRPIVYSALGTHANYAVPGVHTRKVSVVKLNDYTSAGPLWDPVLNAYFYTFTPTSPDPTSNDGTFQAAQPPDMGNGASNNESPTDWLQFYGHWGNKQLPDSNPDQSNLGGVTYTWEDGPTGPYDKDLNRDGTCPGDDPCVTLTVLPSVVGNPSPSTTITRPTTSSTSTSSTTSSTTTSSTSTTSSTTSSTMGPTSTGGMGGGGNSGTQTRSSPWLLTGILSYLAYLVFV